MRRWRRHGRREGRQWREHGGDRASTYDAVVARKKEAGGNGRQRADEPDGESAAVAWGWRGAGGGLVLLLPLVLFLSALLLPAIALSRSRRLPPCSGCRSTARGARRSRKCSRTSKVASHVREAHHGVAVSTDRRGEKNPTRSMERVVVLPAAAADFACSISAAQPLPPVSSRCSPASSTASPTSSSRPHACLLPAAPMSPNLPHRRLPSRKAEATAADDSYQRRSSGSGGREFGWEEAD
ncbi:Os09g0312675 [Oryza sativa Japonica Group]|uniref:Os09g0312675 protein n=1 Tax=Oryza sativa subsp. japonica TaxID=39947 RepID=A0A0P0XLD5_ORYSJ|nr:Os09g0312675 [Oryza sativa Japonica Group]